MVEKNFFQDTLFLSDPDVVRCLSDVAHIEYVPKKKLLAETGEIQNYLAFVLTGVLRGFLLDEDGQDTTDFFAFRFGDVVIGCNALDEPSKINIETLTDCQLLLVPVSTVLNLMKDSRELLEIYNKLLMAGIQRHWQEKILLLRCSAMERYTRFLDDYPGLIDLISNKHIASFLGITPVTLSRLRRQLREKERAGNAGKRILGTPQLQGMENTTY